MILAVGAILLAWIGVVTVSWLLSQILGWVYYAFCETRPARGTPGKQLLALQVTDLQGGTVSWGRATLRHLFKFAAYFPFLIVLAILIARFWAGGVEGAGKALAIALVLSLVASPLLLFAFYALAGWTRDKRALHDLLSGCRVVRATELSGGRMVATVAGIVFFFFVVEILLPAALRISRAVERARANAPRSALSGSTTTGVGALSEGLPRRSRTGGTRPRGRVRPCTTSR